MTLPLEDAGGVRSLYARWVVTATLALRSAAHLGGRSGESVDLLLLRDGRDGAPLLPGTSLAGALRGHLADVLGGYRSTEDAAVRRLFGGGRADDLGSQSPLLVFDALGRLPEGGRTEIRDGVALDGANGTAEDHKKFDFELLPAGTTFPLRLELSIESQVQEGELLSLLCACLDGIERSELALGARRSRGLGSVAARGWRAHRHDLGSAAGWLAWLRTDPNAPIPHSAVEHDSVVAAVRVAAPAVTTAPVDDRRRRVVIDAQLNLTGPILVRSPAATADAPDVSHLTSGGVPVLPGTGVAGALRARALRIARFVREQQNDAERWIDRLFSPRLEGTVAPEDWAPTASRLRLTERVIDNGAPVRQSRIRIDRFTQGVVRGALFDEQPHQGGHTSLQIELRNPEPGEIGLVLLVLKDLLDGDLPVGGSASVGRGRMGGSATIQFGHGEPIALVVDGEPDGADGERISRELEVFHTVGVIR